jgi:hypothetical protein
MKNFNKIFTAIAVLGIFLVGTMYVYSWTGPGSTPPSGNIGIFDANQNLVLIKNGSFVLPLNSGSFNVAIGSSTLISNTTGNSNTGVGYQSLRMNAEVIIIRQAGINLSIRMLADIKIPQTDINLCIPMEQVITIRQVDIKRSIPTEVAVVIPLWDTFPSG